MLKATTSVFFASAFLMSGARAKDQKVSVKASTINILQSETLPGNLLPNFMFQQGSIEGGSVGVKLGGGRGPARPFSPDDSCGDDIFEGAMEDMRSPQLPYLTQDLWTCDRTPEDLPVYTMENEDLVVTVTPQYAGKVWGIYDKKRKKELLFANRAHQPANIGALKSWAAGGSEWNWSPGIIGHSAFSETQVFLGSLQTEKGPLLRVYEFDRYNGTVWQVDMLLVNDSFIAHPRITNPTDKDLRGYWWTCVAVESLPSTRIYAPATHVAETSRDPMRNAPWPFFAEAIENATFAGYEDAWLTDNSYLGNHQIGDMFLRIPDTVYTPYIAHNQEADEGFTLVHGHPLNGTKFFTWGQSGPGRFMQDFLAGGGKRQGDYTELQVGPAPTQMQNFPVPKESITEWTEWFKGFFGDEKVLRGADYQAALNEIDAWIRSEKGMPREAVSELDAFFHEQGSRPVDTVLVEGQPWGYLEERLLGKKLAPGLVFTAPKNGTLAFKEAQPWVELLEKGEFSAQTLQKLPLSYQTTDRWLAVLERSAQQGAQGVTWLHALHLGIAYAERGAIEEPKKYFAKSYALKPNPLAARNLAVLQSTPQEAWPFFQQAWSVLHSDFKNDEDAYLRLTRNLITEISFFLQQNLWYEEMAAFAEDVLKTDFLKDYEIDAFLTMYVKSLIHKKDFTRAKEILGTRCFPTYAKARGELMDMWNQVSVGIAEQEKGQSLTILEKHRVRVNNRIPDNIGCQYASAYCDNYW